MTNYELLKKLRELKIAVDLHGYDSLKVFYFGDDEKPPREALPLIEKLKERKPEIIKLLEDPRPDLQEDSHLWQEVLLKAKQIDSDIHGSLHGFRGVGCTLEVKGDSLQMIPSDYWRSEASYREDKMEFLMPHKENIKQIFKEVAEEVKN